MNNIVLEVRRPKIKNICWAAMFAAFTAVCVAVLVFDVLSVPVTVSEKAVNCIVFALSAAWGTVFLFCTANCIRNLFSEAVITLDNDNLTVFRKGTIALEDLAEVCVSPKKNKISFTSKRGETISVSQNSLSVPVDTIEYAVRCRTEK